MLRTQIVAVGRVKEPYLRAGMAEYEKRLRAYTQFSVAETKEEPYRESAGRAERERLLEREGDALLRAAASDYLVALDIEGKALSSPDFAHWLQAHQDRAGTPVTFVVGGSLGLAESVKRRAAWHLSFGPITLPHQLARLVLMEQLYRAFTIIRGEPYHK